MRKILLPAILLLSSMYHFYPALAQVFLVEKNAGLSQPQNQANNNGQDNNFADYTWYQDLDGDGYGNPEVSTTTPGNTAPTGYVSDNTDCDDTDAAINPASIWYLNVDDDGDSYSPGDAWVGCTPPSVGNWVLSTETYLLGGGDCNDYDSYVYPGIWYLDFDGDGYGSGYSLEQCERPYIPSGQYWKRDWELYATSGDCYDENPDTNPGANEICGNGFDDNCNGLIDEVCNDNDGDGFTPDDGDCNDADANVNPGVDEVCGNGIDDNCNGVTDTDGGCPVFTFYRDADGDGYGNAAVTVISASNTPPSGYVANNTDCNDEAATIYPTANEIYGNGIDDNCDGFIDDGPCTVLTNRLYVNTAALTNGNGSNWQCAIKELRDAVAIANANLNITEIWLAKGTYKPTADANRDASITITNDMLKILGGFAGTETAASQADPVNNITTISGDIGVAGNIDDNSYHLLKLPAVSASSLYFIDGLTFEKANANIANQGDNNNGGAILVYGGYTNNPVPTLKNITVRRCLFTANNALSAGGALSFNTGSNFFNTLYVNFDSCVFIGNTAGNGGALKADRRYYVGVKNSLFSQNKATFGSGGTSYSNEGYIAFANTTFDRNIAAISGGAVYTINTVSSYVQCVFSKNSAANGGATYHIGGASVHLCTFFGNTASISGGAMELSFDDYNELYASNNIFWKNKKGAATNVAGSDIMFARRGNANYPILTVNNNIFQVSSSVPPDNGTNIKNNLRGTDPLFMNENSPAGADGYFGYLSDGLELKNASPAKNIGNIVFGLEPTDILGRNRFACGALDLGAYENQNCATLIVKSDGIIKSAIKTSPDASVTNPFRNNLMIRYTGGEKAEVDITTLTGQKVWKGTAIQKGQTQVNTTSWPSGMYQVTIRTASSKPIIFKVIKAQ